MNLDPKNIQATARALFKSRNGVPYVNQLHPNRDWMVGVCVGVCIVVGITAWSAYTYVQYRSGDLTSEEIVVVNPSYQAALVSEALDVFVQRSAGFALVSPGAGVPVVIEETPQEQATTTATTTIVEVEGEVEQSEEVLIQGEIDTEPIAVKVPPEIGEDAEIELSQ